MIKKRYRKYRQMKKQGTDELNAEVKELQREVQRKLRQSYWNYMGSLFNEPPKRKQRRALSHA